MGIAKRECCGATAGLVREASALSAGKGLCHGRLFGVVVRVVV